MKGRRFSIFAGLWRQGLPCVGLIVLLGSLTFIIAPDPEFMPSPNGGPPRGAAGNGPPTVVIDPGHGGIDEGTKYYGLAEKDMTLDVAGRLEQVLNHAHVANVLTRTSDVYVSLPQRVEIANRLADSNSNVIYVSIHFNQSPVETVDGIETYYADQKIPPPTDWTWIGFFDHPENDTLDLGENLAADIQGALVSQMQTANRGIKSRSLFVVRHTRMPAVLVEGGFLSNKLENQSLRNDSYRDRIAQGIATGLLAYIRTMHTQPVVPPPHLTNAPAAPREL